MGAWWNVVRVPACFDQHALGRAFFPDFAYLDGEYTDVPQPLEAPCCVCAREACSQTGCTWNSFLSVTGGGEGRRGSLACAHEWPQLSRDATLERLAMQIHVSPNRKKRLRGNGRKNAVWSRLPLHVMNQLFTCARQRRAGGRFNPPPRPPSPP